MRTILVASLLIASACSQTPPRAADAPAPAPSSTFIASEPVPASTVEPAPTAPSAAPVPAAPTAAPPAADKELATLARDACYGFCPVYRVTVYANGVVNYEGENFVKVRGKASGQLDEAALTRLKQAFETAKFGSLKNSYETMGRTDAPTAVISLGDGAQKKTVRHYHGDMTAPAALSTLEDEIDSVVRIEQWIGTPEERANNAGKWRR